MIKIRDFNDSFEMFNMLKYKTDEYFMKGKFLGHPGKRVPVNGFNSIYAEKLHEEVIDHENSQTVVVKDVAVERFYPTNINNKEFWVEAKKNFPYLSVCGSPSKSIKEVNSNTMRMPKMFGFLDKFDELIEESEEKLSVLEIGFGYGNVFFDFKERCDYIGIDYSIAPSLKRYKHFIEIEESGIPEYLFDNKFDVVYSVNVLQHCTQEERFNYFKQAYDILKPGGHMMFTLFLHTDENKNKHEIWGIKDKNGRYYTQFFNQLTEVDFSYELSSVLKEIGFNTIKGSLASNCLGMIMQKI